MGGGGCVEHLRRQKSPQGLLWPNHVCLEVHQEQLVAEEHVTGLARIQPHSERHVGLQEGRENLKETSTAGRQLKQMIY